MNVFTRVSRIVKATPDRLYEAFMDPAVLVRWLPPGDMTGTFHAFDARVGGGYRMSLFYPEAGHGFRGKTADNEDMVSVRFVELAPPHRIVEAVTFHTTDTSLMGEMILEVMIRELAGGTEVAIACRDLPPGLRAEDNEAGTRQSLEKLSRLFEERQLRN